MAAALVLAAPARAADWGSAYDPQCAAGGAACAPPAPLALNTPFTPAAQTWGLSDPGPYGWVDPDAEHLAAFRALMAPAVANQAAGGAIQPPPPAPGGPGVTVSRIVVPWDAGYATPHLGPSSDARHLAQVDAWVRWIAAYGLQGYVSFEHVQAGGFDADDPAQDPLLTADQYRAAVQAFIARYRAYGAGSWFYSAWNEPDHATQPTRGHGSERQPAGFVPSPGPPAIGPEWHFGAAMAATYANVLRDVCATPPNQCTAIPGDFAGGDDVNWDTNLWYRTYKHFLAGPNPVWAWHDYGDIREGSVSRLVRFMQSVAPARVWVTEVGAVYHRSSSADPDPDEPTLTAAAVRYFDLPGRLAEASTPDFDAWAHLYGLIYWSWVGGADFDSGMISRLHTADGRLAFRAPLYDAFRRLVFTPVAGPLAPLG